jgi:hypothetical protein
MTAKADKIIKQLVGLSQEELTQVNTALVAQSKLLSKLANAKVKNSLNVGDRVWFTSKMGSRVEGHVTRIMRKNVEMKDALNKTTWRVSPVLLNHS